MKANTVTKSDRRSVKITSERGQDYTTNLTTLTAADGKKVVSMNTKQDNSNANTDPKGTIAQ